MFKPGSVSETKNHDHQVVCVLPNMLQQQSEEGNHFPECDNTCSKALKISLDVPFISFLHVSVSLFFLYKIPLSVLLFFS